MLTCPLVVRPPFRELAPFRQVSPQHLWDRHLRSVECRPQLLLEDLRRLLDRRLLQDHHLLVHRLQQEHHHLEPRPLEEHLLAGHHPLAKPRLGELLVASYRLDLVLCHLLHLPEPDARTSLGSKSVRVRPK